MFLIQYAEANIASIHTSPQKANSSYYDAQTTKDLNKIQ